MGKGTAERLRSLLGALLGALLGPPAILNGRVFGPEDAGYNEARTIFYGGIDYRPAVIVRPADATEVSLVVSLVVSLARKIGVELAVRSGGHSLAGHGVSAGASYSIFRACGCCTSMPNNTRHGLRRA